MQAWGSLPVFPETVRVLDELRQAGWRMAVLTNRDDDLFALTAPKLGVRLDEVVTAEQIGSYKPRLAHFQELARRTGADSSTWVHTAGAWVIDMVPTSRLGLSRVWINREASGYDSTLATAVIDDLTPLPQLADQILTAQQSAHRSVP